MLFWRLQHTNPSFSSPDNLEAIYKSGLKSNQVLNLCRGKPAGPSHPTRRRTERGGRRKAAVGKALLGAEQHTAGKGQPNDHLERFS